MRIIEYKGKFYTPVAVKKTAAGFLYLIIITKNFKKWILIKDTWREFLAR